MKRIHKTLLTALVALGGGGGAALYAYFGDARHADERTQAADQAKRRFEVATKDVSGGVLHTRGATISFTRDELWGWRLTSPVDGPADLTAVEALIDRVSQLRAEVVDTGEVTPEVLRRYELDRPREWVELSTREGSKVLVVGPKNALDGRYFVTDAARKTVWLADPAFHWALDRSVEAFRETRIFPVTQGQVVAIRMSTPKGLSWELRRGPGALPGVPGASGPSDSAPDAGAGKARNEAAGWLLRAGEGAPPEDADEGEVNYFLVLLTNRLRAEHWLTDRVDPKQPESLASWGFKPFELAVDLELVGGRHVVGRFGWYRETASEKVTPVMWIEGTSTVVEAPVWAKKDLDKPAEQLRDRLLSRYEVSDVRRLRFTLTSGEVVVVERASADAAWTVAPSGTPALTWRVEPFLRVASRLRASRLERLAPTAAEKAAFGMAPPAQRIVVEGAGGEVLSDLGFGKDAEGEELYLGSATLDRVGRYGKKLRQLIPERGSDFVDATGGKPDAGAK